MKLHAYSRYDGLLQAVVVPIYLALLNWILIGSSYWQTWPTFGVATGLTLLITFSIWYVNNYLALLINRLHPDVSQTQIRIIRRLLATSLSACLHVVLLFGLYHLIDLPGFGGDGSRLFWALLFTTAIVVIVVVAYEGLDNFMYWMQTRQQVEMLSHSKRQAELNALRQQVNPHFLFNSLNSLTALIGEDPAKAEAFSEELSTVYRYLLRSNETSLVTLSSELDFLDSYYHLLKTRHGDSLTLIRHVLPGTEDRLLPPLTLQLLIENAVKHNVIMPDQPLTIHLQTDEANRLVVRNNIQRKVTRALSNGVGLSNILSKYQMLNQPAPSIEDDGREFRVTLPLV